MFPNNFGQTAYNNARHFLKEDNVLMAYPHYLTFLFICPEAKETHMEEFLLLLERVTKCLREEGRIESMFKIYKGALELCPDNLEIMNNYAADVAK